MTISRNVTKGLKKEQISEDEIILAVDRNESNKLVDIDDVTTVVGFKKELIMESFPQINYVTIMQRYFFAANFTK